MNPFENMRFILPSNLPNQNVLRYSVPSLYQFKYIVILKTVSRVTTDAVEEARKKLVEWNEANLRNKTKSSLLYLNPVVSTIDYPFRQLKSPASTVCPVPKVLSQSQQIRGWIMREASLPVAALQLPAHSQQSRKLGSTKTYFNTFQTRNPYGTTT